MSDSVVLNPGVGGSTVITETIGGQEMPVSKLYVGAHGTNGGPVTSANPLPTQSPALGTWKVTNYTVGTSATQILATALTGRQSLVIVARQDNTDGVPIWVNTTNAVAVGSGFPLFPGQALPADLAATATAIWAISASSNQHLDAIEVGT